MKISLDLKLGVLIFAMMLGAAAVAVVALRYFKARHTHCC